MTDALELLTAGVEATEESDDLDLTRLRSLIDRQEATFARLARAAVRRGAHQLSGRTPVCWVASTCSMSPTSASDRLCVGEQLEAMPRVAESLSAGEIGYQSVSVICHLRDKLGEKSDLLDEALWVGFAREFSVKNLRLLAQHQRYVLDPDGFERDTEEDYEQRYLHLSPMGSLYRLDAVLDPESGAALRAAIDGLARRLGESDARTPKQRRADAFTEIVYHAMDKGTLPRRNRVRPHISVTTTIDGLKGELGAAAPELQTGAPVSSKTVLRLACDGMLSRVLKADSVVVDVGRATPSVSPAQWRALKSRHRSCAFPGCDRPVGWTSPHHVEFRSRGGPTNLSNLLPLCYHHHRLVHEGGWQVVRAGEGFRFIPNEKSWVGTIMRRWGERAA